MEIKELMHILQSFSSSYYLYTIFELGVLDIIGESGVSEEVLTLELDMDKTMLIRIMRPLIALDIVSQVGEKYLLLKLGKQLIEPHIKNSILMCGREGMKCWENFYLALVSKKKPYEIVNGKNPFDEQAENKDKFIQFNANMETSSKRVELDEFFAKYKSQEKKKIVDIGGGTGSIIFKFLFYFKNSFGTIVDLEVAREFAEKNIILNSLQERCDFQVGNFFENISIKGDFFILSRVLHDWEDSDARKILYNIENAMEPENHLLIIEKIIPEKINRDNYKLCIDDLNVWAMCGGQERTISEYIELVTVNKLIFLDKYFVGDGKYLLDFKFNM